MDYTGSHSIPMPPPVINTLNRLHSNSSTNTNSTSLPSNNLNATGIPNIPGITSQSPGSTNIINLNKSSDVVIGPMTQYKDAVTIYQYMDATVDTTKRRQGPNLSLEGSNENLICFQNIPRWIIILLVCAIILGIGTGVLFSIFGDSNQPTESNEKSEKDIFFEGNTKHGQFLTLGGGHVVVDRYQWGAATHYQKGQALTHPIPYVVVTHDTNPEARPCNNIHTCSAAVRELQDFVSGSKKRFDIPANFYIGGDGYIYVGRGWNHTNALNSKNLLVSFIGNFDVNVPTENQFDAMKHLLSYGIASKILDIKYKLISQNQTAEMSSPGKNIYNEIIKYPRWWSCGYNEILKCGEEIGVQDYWVT